MTHSVETDSFFVIRQKSDGWFILRTGGLHHDFKDGDARFETYDDAFQHWAYEIDRCEILYVQSRHELTVDKG